MRVLFWGTPEFAVPSLRALAEEGHDVVGVVTQPDRPAGRGRQLRASAVKRVALEEGGYPVLTPDKPKGAEFVASVRDALLNNDIPPWALELELTESVLLSNDDRTAATLAALVELGVSLALDDFGTGYSSLSYLRRYPVQVIKIDRSFVSDIPRNPDASAIASTVIAMARTLRKRTVAEGIETVAQLEYLRERGCDTGQGYLFSKAVPADELARLITEQRSRIEETIRAPLSARHSA